MNVLPIVLAFQLVIQPAFAHRAPPSPAVGEPTSFSSTFTRGPGPNELTVFDTCGAKTVDLSSFGARARAVCSRLLVTGAANRPTVVGLLHGSNLHLASEFDSPTGELCFSRVEVSLPSGGRLDLYPSSAHPDRWADAWTTGLSPSSITSVGPIVEAQAHYRALLNQLAPDDVTRDHSFTAYGKFIRNGFHFRVEALSTPLDRTQDLVAIHGEVVKGPGGYTVISPSGARVGVAGHSLAPWMHRSVLIYGVRDAGELHLLALPHAF